MILEEKGRGKLCTHLLKVYATHAGHATHTTHITHTWVVIKARRAFLLILINPLGKVGLDVRTLKFFFREAGPILELDILFTNVKHE